MSYIISKYKIIYPDYNIIQFKNLISQEDFLEQYKPLVEKISDLEEQLSNYKKKSETYKFIELEIKNLKNYIKINFGDFFTTESPLFKSLKNKSMLILPESQGGQHKVILEKL